MTKSELFKRAWEISREAAATFGGSVKSYFSEALKQAWEESKEMGKKENWEVELENFFDGEIEKKKDVKFVGGSLVEKLQAIKAVIPVIKENEPELIEYLKKRIEGGKTKKAAAKVINYYRKNK